MNIKKIILNIFLVVTTVTFLVSRFAVALGLCDSTNYSCRLSYDTIENIFIFGPIISVIFIPILFLPPHYFTRFWNFAIWGLPLTLGVIIYINLTYSSGLFGFGAGFDLLLIGASYLFFFLGTLIQLFRGWRTGH